MTEMETDTTTAPEPESFSPPADEQPKGEDRIEHAKHSLIHAVEAAVGKVTDTLGSIGGRK